MRFGLWPVFLVIVLLLLAELPARAADDTSGRPADPFAIGLERIKSRLPGGVSMLADVSYQEPAREAWLMDIFLPPASFEGPRPGVVFIHGGGWASGSRRRPLFVMGALEFAAAGYVTACVNYRLAPEAPFPAQLYDLKAAIRFLRAHANEYRLDPTRIGVFGNSAGAHLGALLALTRPADGLEGPSAKGGVSSQVQAACLAATPTDMADPFWRDKQVLGLLLPRPELVAPASPLTHARADAPPILLIHGEKDETVPVDQARRLAQALEQAGAADVTLLVLEKAGHMAFNQARGTTQPARMEFFKRILEP